MYGGAQIDSMDGFAVWLPSNCYGLRGFAYQKRIDSDNQVWKYPIGHEYRSRIDHPPSALGRLPHRPVLTAEIAHRLSGSARFGSLGLRGGV
jgi:hypothetical protein